MVAKRDSRVKDFRGDVFQTIQRWVRLAKVGDDHSSIDCTQSLRRSGSWDAKRVTGEVRSKSSPLKTKKDRRGAGDLILATTS